MTSSSYSSGDIDICQRILPPADNHYYEPSTTYFSQIYTNTLDNSAIVTHHADISGNSHLIGGSSGSGGGGGGGGGSISLSGTGICEEGYWGSPCSSDSQNGRECSPSESVSHQSSSPFPHQYAPVYYPPQYDRPSDHIYDEGYYGASTTTTNLQQPVPFVRIVKRRTTANKKERRRTQSINSAFSYLRDCIPNVPSDTKLSKIKTLRLATSYISYLTRVLEGDQDPSGGFRAELVPSSRKINAERRAKNEAQGLPPNGTAELVQPKKSKGRTGWPQHVWASELKQEQ